MKSTLKKTNFTLKSEKRPKAPLFLARESYREFAREFWVFGVYSLGILYIALSGQKKWGFGAVRSFIELRGCVTTNISSKSEGVVIGVTSEVRNYAFQIPIKMTLKYLITTRFSPSEISNKYAIFEDGERLRVEAGYSTREEYHESKAEREMKKWLQWVLGEEMLVRSMPDVADCRYVVFEALQAVREEIEI